MLDTDRASYDGLENSALVTVAPPTEEVGVADVKSSTVVKILTSQTFVDSDNIFPPFNTLQTHWISKQTYSFAESEPRKDLSMGSHPHHLLCMCDRLLALL